MVDHRFTCEDVARAGLGKPAERKGAELYYHCPHPERHRNGDAQPSLKINTKKDTWGCFVCKAGGTAWQLAAFIAGCEPGDKERVNAWLRERGLISHKTGKEKRRRDYHVVETYDYRDIEGRPNLRKHRLEAEGKEKIFTWEHLYRAS